ncbi:hypothetical protein LCGC14_2045060 [marine sediment metagenome]|uniref:Phospholipase C/D domain-containing protein n=1 Tax=marine sediment metagenome TaxID=412755 RepID=A0A0F9FDA9_9ZZZZ
MSEQITHLAVADDTRLLALASPRIPKAVKAVLRDHQDEMRLGAITRGSEGFAGPVVKRLRGRSDRPDHNDATKLAFCLGTMAHRAADRMMKPIFDSQGGDENRQPTSISIYHDVFIFDKVYGRGAKHPYTPDALDPQIRFPSAPDLDVGTVEAYFRVLLQRTLLAAHTFKPDSDDPEGWLDRLFGRLQELHVDLARYHQALTKPDPEIVRRAITDVNFYDDGNAILSLLADLRAEKQVTGEAFLQRCRLGDHDSLYARAVSMAYGYVQVAGEYWQGRTSEELFLDSIRR